MAGKNDCAAGPFEFLDDNILTCELSREKIWRKNQYGFNLTLRYSVAKVIERRAIRASAAETVVLVYALRTDLKIVLSGGGKLL